MKYFVLIVLAARKSRERKRAGLSTQKGKKYDFHSITFQKETYFTFDSISKTSVVLFHSNTFPGIDPSI